MKVYGRGATKPKRIVCSLALPLATAALVVRCENLGPGVVRSMSEWEETREKRVQDDSERTMNLLTAANKVIVPVKLDATDTVTSGFRMG